MFIFPSNTGVTGYAINSAALFDGGYQTLTYGADGNKQTFMFEGWIARDKFGTRQDVISFAQDVPLTFMSDDTLRVFLFGITTLQTSQKFRDTAPMHVALIVDSTNPTSADRVQLLINGERVTTFSTNSQPSLNASASIYTGTRELRLGAIVGGANYTYSKFAEWRYFDGQTHPVSCEINADTGRPEPIDQGFVTADYGTNGVYWKFEDGILGTDSSGNGNNWTVNGTVTAVTNTPTDVMATMNSLYRGGTYTEGNTKVQGATTVTSRSTIALFDKAYFEAEMVTAAGGTARNRVGIQKINNDGQLGTVSGLSWLSDQNAFRENGTSIYTHGSNITTGQRLGFYIDGGSLYGWINGVAVNSGNPLKTGLTASEWAAAFYGSTSSESTKFYFAESEWTNGNVPSGALETTSSNLPEVTGVLSDHFHQEVINTSLGGSDVNIELSWDASVDKSLFIIKNLDSGINWFWADGVRDYDNVLRSSTTGAETVKTIFSVTGSTVTIDVSDLDAGGDHVFYAFRGGPEVTNTDGTISAQVSANQDLGFSIVAATGTGSVGTIGHGLNQEVGMIIAKGREWTLGWAIYHHALGATKSLFFDTSTASTSSAFWNDTEPTTSVFTVGTTGYVNRPSEGMIYYVFAKDSPFLKCFDYTGNGSTDGPFNYNGGEPVWNVFKQYSTSGNSWTVRDRARSPYNKVEADLFLDTSSAEVSDSFRTMDILATGSKQRNSGSGANQNGTGYIGIAVVDPIGSNRPPRGE